MRVLALVAVAAATIRAAPELAPTAAILRRQSIPPCVQACMATAASASGCSLSDFNCLCTTPAFLDATATCFAAQCSDQAALYGTQFGQEACGQIGISESIPPEASSALATKTTAGTSGAFETTFTPAASSSTPAVSSPTPASGSTSSASPSPSASALDSSSSPLSRARLVVGAAVMLFLAV